MSTGLINSLLPNVNTILGVRDSIGAVKQPVYFVKRTWYADANHTTPSSDLSGYAKDVTTQMLPSPLVVDFKQNLKAREGGMVKNGDIRLTGVSLFSFNESKLDGSSSEANVENLFKVGVKMYQVVDLSQDYVTWKITLKELTNQTIY